MTKTTGRHWYRVESPHEYDDTHYATLAQAIAAAQVVADRTGYAQVAAVGISGTCHSRQVLWPTEGRLTEEHY